MNFRNTKHLFLFYLILAHFPLPGQFTITGKVSDVSGVPLPFVAVYLMGTSNGTMTNDEGNYTLKVTGGENTIIFQHLGYSSVSQKVTITSNREVDAILKAEDYDIKEVVVHAGEDPAVGIMRQVIRKRSFYNQNPKPYKAELYIKALMKIIDAPKSFFGQDLGNMDGILDSARQGILYFSESLSNVNYEPPSNYKEELISSKVSGESRGISANQFSYANFNFLP